MVTKVETNPEMDAKIVSLLRFSYDPVDLYAAVRIEELEARVEAVRRVREAARVAAPWLKRMADAAFNATGYAPVEEQGVEHELCDALRALGEADDLRAPREFNAPLKEAMQEAVGAAARVYDELRPKPLDWDALRDLAVALSRLRELGWKGEKHD